MIRLYQYLHDRAIAFWSESTSRGERRTTRTKVTVQELEHMLIVSSDQTLNSVICPFCGGSLESRASANQPASIHLIQSPHTRTCSGQSMKNPPTQKDTDR